VTAEAETSQVTPTPSTHLPAHIYYAIMADARERDPIQGGETANRATVPMGRGFALWQRMNPGEQLVWVDDAEGHPRALTPKQAMVLAAALEMANGAKGMSMRDLASALAVAPSTVSRALVKLAAWGLIGYYIGRGRWAGLVIFRRAKDDGFDRLRDAAKARVQRWKLAAQERVSRLWINVAPYILEEGGRGYRSHYYLATSKGATLTAQRPWTPEELREAGII
jgi:DNA-binding transcriptional ArsR family regulator